MPFQQPPLPFGMKDMHRSSPRSSCRITTASTTLRTSRISTAWSKASRRLACRCARWSPIDGPGVQQRGPGLEPQLYWDCISPKGGGEPKGELAAVHPARLRQLRAITKRQAEAAMKLFVGWAWLAVTGGKARDRAAASMPDTPLKDAGEPVLTIDVLAHAYYVDYRAERGSQPSDSCSTAASGSAFSRVL